MQNSSIQGVLTPLVVPFDHHGAINEPELRRYIDWLIERGVHGLYPNGSTGEFTRFTVEERRNIIRIVCDQVAGRVPVLAGAAEANVKEILPDNDLIITFKLIISPWKEDLTRASLSHH